MRFVRVPLLLLFVFLGIDFGETRSVCCGMPHILGCLVISLWCHSSCSPVSCTSCKLESQQKYKCLVSHFVDAECDSRLGW